MLELVHRNFLFHSRASNSRSSSKCLVFLTLACAINTLVLSGISSSSACAFETCAIWVDPPSFASPAATDKMLDRCQQAGINLILPNVMSHQLIRYKSSHFKGRVAVTKDFDPLAYVLEKAHARGIKVQPWCCVYYEGLSSAKPLNPEWLQKTIDGKSCEQNFLSPSIPAVNPYLRSVIEDLLAYNIDGIHLDYIRYPGTPFDYSLAGRKAFLEDVGFDPMDFLDHVDRIVPVDQEPFPVRVLHPDAHIARIWETTFIERTLDQAGIGFSFISESAENIRQLRTPGLLIISSYHDVPEEMVQALESFVKRGGTILWTELPAGSLPRSDRLQRLTGIIGSNWLGAQRITLNPDAQQPLSAKFSTKPFRTEAVYAPQMGTATVIATLASGQPAAMLNRVGRGQVVVFSFSLMRSTSPVVASLAKAVADWSKGESGITGEDILAKKRAEWVAWRANRVTELVRDVSHAVKQKSPHLVVSSSGGTPAWEFYACYRDARRWLKEGINDELFPMTYSSDPETFTELLELQTDMAPAGKVKRISPGIQLYAKRIVDGHAKLGPMEASIVKKELEIARDQGFQGFCLFSYNTFSDEILEVVKGFTNPNRE